MIVSFLTHRIKLVLALYVCLDEEDVVDGLLHYEGQLALLHRLRRPGYQLLKPAEYAVLKVGKLLSLGEMHFRSQF